jgi:hypothetical protein
MCVKAMIHNQSIMHIMSEWPKQSNIAVLPMLKGLLIHQTTTSSANEQKMLVAKYIYNRL